WTFASASRLYGWVPSNTVFQEPPVSWPDPSTLPPLCTSHLVTTTLTSFTPAGGASAINTVNCPLPEEDPPPQPAAATTARPARETIAAARRPVVDLSLLIESTLIRRTTVGSARRSATPRDQTVGWRGRAFPIR